MKSVIASVLTLALPQDVFTNKLNDLSIRMQFVTRYYGSSIYFSFCVVHGCTEEEIPTIYYEGTL